MGRSFPIVVAKLPPDEEIRLAKLRSLKVLDTLPENEFDTLVAAAADLLDVPVVLVSLVDHDRQWFKAKVGLDVCETSRDVAFCAHAILQTEPFIVPDATLDPRFYDNPLVTGEFHLRFYAGVPITVDGRALGTLCCIDHKARQFSEGQIRGLVGLARQAEALLIARILTAKLAESERRFSTFLDNAPVAAFLKDAEGRLCYANNGFAALAGENLDSVLGRLNDEWLPAEVASVANMDDKVVAETRQTLELDQPRTYSSGASKVWRIVKFPVESEGQTLVGGFAVDITKEREATAALNSKNRELVHAGLQLENAVEAARNAELTAKVSATRFEHLFSGLPIACYTFDAEGTIQEWNGAAEQLWGIPAHEAVMMPVIGTAVCERNVPIEQDIARRVFEGGESVTGLELLETLKDGSHRILVTNTIPLRGSSGQVVGALRSNVDITEQRATEASLAESEERFRTAIHSMHEGLVLQDQTGKIVVSNDQASEILGLTRDQLLGRSSIDPRWRSVHEDGSPWPGETHPVMIALRDGVEQNGQVMGVHRPDGRLNWVSINAIPLFRDGGPKPTSVVCTFNDITSRKGYEAQIARQLQQIQDYADELEMKSAALEVANNTLLGLSNTDSLTGLPNKRYLQERLLAEMAVASREKMPLSIAILDVDKFKSFNDDFGHLAGDAVLKGVAKALHNGLRKGDMVARYGGEEFLVIMPGATSVDAVAAAERLRVELERFGWEKRAVTASFGVATLLPGMTPDMFVEEADRALYKSKRSGRNRVTHSAELGKKMPQSGI